MTYRIGVIAGDGIGPEVIAQALKGLRATGVDFEQVDYDLGARRFLETGEVLPDETLQDMRALDAILLGAVGDPRVPPGILERDLLLRLRFELDLYVNLRPVKLPEGVATPLADKGPDDIDLVVVRENSEGLYSGAGGVQGRGTGREVATQESINTRAGVDRVLEFAFELAERRPRKKLTLAHKTNVLTHAGGLWARAFNEMGEDNYPDIERDYVHIDAACLYLVTQPERFDVVVTDNMFGDILTDIGAAIAGGMGLAASGNLNPPRRSPSLFEPIHGSAPDIAGKGWANPVACILSVAMMLDHLGEAEAARRVEEAALRALSKLRGTAGPEMGFTTDEIGDLVAEAI
ncbi:MAG TPA: 3-isopropylmalate dehydrogenase [Actinomycetota bacterium]|nr:3-isopropylmalate dehydrogenase [Actinomycetota bacterium]